MEEMRTLLYIFRGKLEAEQVGRWKVLERMKQLQGCTATLIYQIDTDGKLYHLGPHGFRSLSDMKTVPEEIKLAAMLV